MKRFIKVISVVLVFTLLIPITLSSCGGYKSKYKTVMEYNGIKLTEELYNYWLATFKRNILASYTDASDTDEFWNSKYDENRTVEEYFTDILNQRIMNYLIAQDLYKKNTLKLSKSVKNSIESDIKEKIEFYGGRGNLNSELSTMMLNVDGLKEIYLWEAKHDLVYEYLFGEGGAFEITDEEILDYYENNYSRIKYVVFYTTDIETDENGDYVYDSEGNLVSKELTEEQMNKKLAKIEEFEGKLSLGTTFDTLVPDYSEYDTSSYPNGFYVSSNEINIWGTEIYGAVTEMKTGEVKRVEEDEAIFYIQKCELTPFDELTDVDIAQLTDLGFTSYVMDKKYDDFFKTLYKDVKIDSEIIAKYKLSKVKPNPFYAI